MLLDADWSTELVNREVGRWRRLPSVEGTPLITFTGQEDFHLNPGMAAAPAVSAADGRPLEIVSDEWVAIAIRNERFELVWCNALYEEWAGAKLPDLLGSRESRIFGSAGGEERDALYKQALEAGKPVEVAQVWRGLRTLTRVSPGVLVGSSSIIVAIAHLAQPSHGELESAAQHPSSAPAIPSLETSHLGMLSCLSRRELEVLYIVGEGSRTTIAAGQLFRSEKTISNHLTRILRKLKMSSRAELARLVAERGLLMFSYEDWSRIASKVARLDDIADDAASLDAEDDDHAGDASRSDHGMQTNGDQPPA